MFFVINYLGIMRVSELKLHARNEILSQVGVYSVYEFSSERPLCINGTV